MIGHGVDLGFFPARAEPEAFDHVRSCEIGGDHWDESLRHQLVDRETLECEFEQRRFAFQIVKLLSRDFCRTLEVDEVESVGEFEMILGRKT